MLINLKHRSEEAEIMDDLESSGEVIDQTLQELDVINRLLGGNHLSIQGLKHLLKKEHPQPITLLDLGCGGGDILILMAKWARKNQFDIRFIGIDANPHIVAYAEKNCSEFPEISFQCLNIFSPEFQALQCDILHASLFTHHFTQTELIDLFQVFKKQARLGIIINDLHRHFLAYYSIKWLTHFFSKSEMVKYDAALSVARGFRKKELMQILNATNIQNYQLHWKWAFRWKLIIG
ncbi:MAG: methyltransferase domain-containing protein [Bacteroidota bacterium]